jgi:hypothetical protein
MVRLDYHPIFKPPLQLGTVVKPWGKIYAVGSLGGERYYWLIDKHDTVSMMPAMAIETAVQPVKSSG